MGGRGSAHRAFGSGIFAYAGYKRNEQGRFFLSFFWVELPDWVEFLRLLVPVPSSCWFALSNWTCRRDTSDASGQQWATARGEVATPFSFSLFIWELCVSVVEALSGNLELFKCSDCRVIRVFSFFALSCCCKLIALIHVLLNVLFLCARSFRLFLY